MAELTKQFELHIKSIVLIPSEGGRFEVTVDDQLVYSKLKTGRHAEAGEVLGLVHALAPAGE
ncbi:MAG: Rdx family protein [Chloroflexi bacterium]|nr:Rdx family protein [Chloroflexota bacterium]MCH8875633.1 Rdx family protein [Chloroflexota bacterium]MCI0772941.1 Rdx family protein [Chloroflexota bacterium]MCI0807360.1 Rdx family protein [Chloroflexota bacterium]MCI0828096.1 Rdx family protein [Chloroflexota bacterium]